MPLGFKLSPLDSDSVGEWLCHPYPAPWAGRLGLGNPSPETLSLPWEGPQSLCAPPVTPPQSLLGRKPSCSGSIHTQPCRPPSTSLDGQNLQRRHPGYTSSTASVQFINTQL